MTWDKRQGGLDYWLRESDTYSVRVRRFVGIGVRTVSNGTLINGSLMVIVEQAGQNGELRNVMLRRKLIAKRMQSDETALRS
jgi:hypothetical protein